MVGGRATDQFVMAVEMLDQSGVAEPGNGGGLKNEGVNWDLVCSIDFRAVSMTVGLGDWRSKAKNAPKKNQRLGGVSRIAVPGLAKLKLLTFNIAWARCDARGWPLSSRIRAPWHRRWRHRVGNGTVFQSLPSRMVENLGRLPQAGMKRAVDAAISRVAKSPRRRVTLGLCFLGEFSWDLSKVGKQ